MIKKKCFEKNWIIQKHKELKADPILVEKAIYAFELLGSLLINGVELIFKGGTGLILLLPEIKRLSIDIDIVSKAKQNDLIKSIEKTTTAGVFKRWEEDSRILNHKIDKKHYKFYYDSILENRESYILLDIVFSDYSFVDTTEKLVKVPLFKIEKEVKVSIPTVNSYIADKLTAFAPRTIGIPFRKNKSMEIIKQLFDLNNLFNEIDNLLEIDRVYRTIAQSEASYRNLDNSIDSFLKDSIYTSFLISQLDFRKCIENDYTKELRDGIKQIKSHIIGGKYSLLNAKENASKIACLATLILNKQTNFDIKELEFKEKDLAKIREIELKNEYAILNKLKPISPESFYLWCIATGLI
ncbi:MAG TPA: hypothetical protein DCK79_00990 [Candidatus Atribacteria bacterium]|jgi:predicted nucleotidyltransferase component of viral defense system|nr:hypothetical protein [Candidatus Atribacteria bacterium]